MKKYTIILLLFGLTLNLPAQQVLKRQKFIGDTVQTALLFVPGTLGIEKISNGDFTSDLSDWAGTNWAWSAGTALHTTGSIDSLKQTTTTAIVGETYKIVYTITGRSAGWVEPYFGGIWGGLRQGDGTFTEYITATATDYFHIRPSSTFDGAISDVSIKKITSGESYFETTTDFRKEITIRDRINFADGLPISIGYNSLPLLKSGYYANPSSNIAIGNNAGALNSSGHITGVGYYAGYNNTTGVLTAVGKWAGYNNTDGHATFFGNAAGFANTIGEATAIGDESGRSGVDVDLTTVGYYSGQLSTKEIDAFGYYAAQANVSGDGISAFGYRSLLNTTSSYNSAFGNEAGLTNSTGLVSAFGYRALYANTTGEASAFGYEAGTSNTTGKSTSVGHRAGYYNTTGNSSSLGYEALRSNTTSGSVAMGYQAGYSNTTGVITAIGYQAGYINTTGSLIALGYRAGHGADNFYAPEADTFGILIGHEANRSVARSTVLTNYIGIGKGVLIDKSNQVKIGNSSITETNLYGQVNIGTIPASTVDQDHFLVDSAGTVKFRTGAEVLSDIGAMVGSGVTNYLTRWSDANTLDTVNIFRDGGELRLNSAVDAGDYKLQLYGNTYFNDDLTVNGSDLFGNTTGTQLRLNSGVGSELIFGNQKISLAADNNIYVYSNSDYRWYWDQNGHYIPYANGAVDIGTSSYRVRDIYTGSANLSGQLTIGTINAATTDLDRFLVDSAGIVKRRTGAGVLSDIGLTAGNQLLPSATEGQMLYKGASAWTSTSDLFWDDAHNALGVNTATPLSIGGSVASIDVRSGTTGSAAGGGLTLGTSAALKGYIYSYGDDVYTGSSDGFYSITSDAGERIRVLKTGEVVVKGTSASGFDFYTNGTIGAATSITAPAIKLTTGAAAGYFLQSDADGDASWVSVAASQVYKGTVDGDDGTVNGTATALIDGTGTAGWYYRCIDAGTYDYGNPSGNSITLAVGDDIYYNGSIWQKIPGAGYTLQAMTASVLGGAKLGSSLNMASDVLDIKDGDKGDITVGSTGTTFTIDNSAVTLAKIANIATAKVLGRTSAGSGVVEELSTTGTGTVVLNTGGTLVAPAIGKISNLTGNGLVKTSGGDGTLGTATAGVDYVAPGGTITGGAGYADSIKTVVENASASFFYPTFTLGATGGKRIPYQSTKLSFTPSTGLLGATGFAGLFSGLSITNNGGNTFNLAAGKTFTVSRTMQLTAGAEGGVYTMPSSAQTMVGLTSITDDEQLTFGASGAADSYIKFDGLNSNLNIFSGGDIYFYANSNFNTNATGFNIPTGKKYQINGTNILRTPSTAGTSKSTWDADSVLGASRAAISAYVAANSAGVSDVAYGSSWDGVTTVAPSKNAVYDKLVGMGEIYSNVVTITAAQLDGAYATPVSLVAAPGTNRDVQIISITAQLNYLTAPFSDQDLYIYASGLATYTTQYQAVIEGGLLANGSSAQWTVPLNPNQVINLNSNAAILLKPAADITAGGGSLKLHILYRIIDMN